MNVAVRIRFDKPTQEDWDAIRSLARQLTDNHESVRVFVVPEEANWLVTEFTMPKAPQMASVNEIDRALKFTVENRLDSMIGFPRSAAEEERARRKNERRKAQRREARGES